LHKFALIFHFAIYLCDSNLILKYVIVLKDTAQSAVVAPMQDAVMDEVVNNVGCMGEATDVYEDMVENTESLHAVGNFIYESFFQ